MGQKQTLARRWNEGPLIALGAWKQAVCFRPIADIGRTYNLIGCVCSWNLTLNLRRLPGLIGYARRIADAAAARTFLHR